MGRNTATKVIVVEITAKKISLPLLFLLRTDAYLVLCGYRYFCHNDGVIHYQTYGQYHRQHGQHIDGETCYVHHKESSDQ